MKLAIFRSSVTQDAAAAPGTLRPGSPGAATCRGSPATDAMLCTPYQHAPDA